MAASDVVSSLVNAILLPNTHFNIFTHLQFLMRRNFYGNTPLAAGLRAVHCVLFPNFSLYLTKTFSSRKSSDWPMCS